MNASAKVSRRSLLGLVVMVLVLGAASQWWAGRQDSQIGQDVAALARAGDIRMLASDSCGVCQAARAWFVQHQVPFSECSIEREPACKARFDASGALGTPVLLVRGQAQLGFSPARLQRALQSLG